MASQKWARILLEELRSFIVFLRVACVFQILNTLVTFLRATRGAHNPNLQVARRSFELALSMHGIHRTQSDYTPLVLLSLVI